MKMLTKDLEDRIDEIQKQINSMDDTISTQEDIIENAEACIEELTVRRNDLRGERNDLERLKTGRDVAGREAGSTKTLSMVNGKYSVVRDPREKFRFCVYPPTPDSNSLVITDEGVWGCEDLYPHKDSELVFITEVVV